VSDEFTTRLLKIMKTVHAEGVRQKVAFGIHRSDYMVHKGQKLQQVELNTISSAFGALSSRTSLLHDYILQNWLRTQGANFKLPPPNKTLETFTAAFKLAVDTYAAGRSAATSAPFVFASPLAVQYF
jgi:glutathione synthase